MNTDISEQKQSTGIISLLKNSNFVFLLIANVVSRFGDAIDAIAYGWMVYELTGSKLLLGTLFAVNAIPNIILSPFAGGLADRVNKKKLMFMSYIGRGIIVCILAVMYITNILRPWHLFVFTIINSSLETLMTPASMAILPLIVPKESFLSANAFTSSINTFAELIGTGLAGLIIGIWGTGGAILVDGATFFLSAMLIIFVRITVVKNETSLLDIKSYGRDLKEGITIVFKNSIIRVAILLFAIINFCLAPINVLMPVYITEILKSGPEVYSLLGMALALGTILGGILVGSFGSKFKISNLIIGGFFIMGIFYSLLSVPGTVVDNKFISIGIATMCYFGMGFMIPGVIAPLKSHLMTSVEPSLLGRVVAFLGMVNLSAIPLGSALAGVLSEIMSISLLFLVAGIGISMISLSLLFNKTFRNAQQ